ncbi:hypothetical protein [uncultured Roseobacter sp.]|uniref:hypothetical protein n=1 Tax=uncultured Roseobacter sp. TaxID=114847 RepID=UPI00262E1C07|nr:hypothetical protein [uncultured Roseobacter sp.]
MHIVIGLIVAFIVVALYARRNRATRRCRWREDRTGDRGNLRKYKCATCGAEAYTAQKGPPRDCKSHLPPV